VSATAHAHASPVGGKLLTPGYLIILGIALVGGVLGLYRFAVGLGATTAMSDGYPWGIWIAFDVVTGTAMGAGGYALALLIYVLNNGKYHPLIRGALVTTALGYTIAGVSVMLDVGRWWHIWKIPLFVTQWNGNSALLEVAVCIIAYMMVAWIEVSSTLFEHWGKKGNATAQSIHVGLRKALPFVIALGVLLPTMHQSSLGTLMMLTVRLHPLWHSQLMPLLFLVSCIAMGFGGVILESAISHTAFRREIEWPLLAKVGTVVAYFSLGYVVLRLADVFYRGAFAGASGGFIALFALELALFVVPAVVMLTDLRKNPGVLFGSAFALILGGALYRFDTYLVAYNAGANWTYFPSVTELMITFGLVATEIAVYVFIVKKFPILAGRRPEPA
jgi:Ni/Fe-hydrogenase subunit HybB-like protein